jgi:hypothetical protein
VCCHYGVFKVRVDRLCSGLSKLNSMKTSRSTFF